MSIWAAVIFFCAGECAFWRANDVFDTNAQCEKSLSEAMALFEARGIQAAGACIEIKVTRI